MEQGTPWEADSFSDSREVFSILWNSKVRYRVHNSLLLFPILSHMNHVHAFPFCLFTISFNIFRSSTLRSSKWSLIPSKLSMYFSSLIRATCSAHHVLHELITLIIFCGEYMSRTFSFYIFFSVLLFPPTSTQISSSATACSFHPPQAHAVNSKTPSFRPT